MSRKTIIAALGMLLTAGCANGRAVDPSIPPASLYESPVDFVGEWFGEYGEIPGTLVIRDLGAQQYYGMFRGEGEPVQYVLNMTRTRVTVEGGESRPANRLLFTWQDGRGGLGHGWLLINREDTALTGEFGYGDARRGAGSVSFIRVQ